MPDLPGLGPSTALPSPLGQQPLPSPSALPSPLVLPPLSPRGAGIDSPDDSGTDTSERKGSKGGGIAGGGGPTGIPQGGVGPPSIPRVTPDQPGGIEQGKGGPRMPPRGTVPEGQLREPSGPAHPSDTPVLPQPPATPSDRPEAVRERADAQAERARQAERIARGGDGGEAREAALPPPPGLGGLRPRSRSASSQSFHRGPPDERDAGNSSGNGGLWTRIKQFLSGRR